MMNRSTQYPGNGPRNVSPAVESSPPLCPPRMQIEHALVQAIKELKQVAQLQNTKINELDGRVQRLESENVELKKENRDLLQIVHPLCHQVNEINKQMVLVTKCQTELSGCLREVRAALQEPQEASSNCARTKPYHRKKH